MTDVLAWPGAEPIETERLLLEPLHVGHADEMVTVLDDERLHAFIGGRPLALPELRDRYARLALGRSPDGTQGWLNWVVRDVGSGHAAGTVQATLWRDRDGLVAEIAWVTGTAYQGRGYAKEAAVAMVAWLRQHGVTVFVAHVHPAHDASIGVARHLGLTATDTVVDGEVRWTG